MKRFNGLVIVFVLVSLLTGSLSFAGVSSQQEKAEVLNDINILNGDENGYNLSGKLRRSEAAALIVRMVGEESNVLGNKSANVVTVFGDVKSTDWFAPYVGYCYRNGIILGFPDGTFKPNDYISEKAFAQLVFGVMDYKKNIDFTWDNIKLVMYNTGLAEDISYTVDTNDNVNYSRGEAISLLYNSLGQRKKNSEKTVAEVLVDKKVTTESKAKKYGFMKVDELKTAIKSIEVEDKDTIRIKMNEYVLVNAGAVKVLANDAKMTITGFETKGKDIIIDVDDEFYNERSFKVTIDELYDEDGYEMTNLEEEFAGMEREAIESKFFRISKVKPLSSEMLEIYFTQPVDEAAQQVLLYEVYKNGALYFEGSYKTLEIQLNSIDDKSIVLISKQYKFEENSKYKVVIKSDLKSKYNAYLNNGEDDAYEFYGMLSDITSFEVKSASILDQDSIVVKYTDVVDQESAGERSNYYLVDEDNRKISVTSVIVDEYDEDYKYKKVILSVPKLSTNKEYTLNIDEVENLFKTASIENYTKDLGEGESRNEEVELADIEVINRTLIELTFDTPLREKSDRADISIDNSRKIKKKLVNPEDPHKLLVYLTKTTPLKEDKEYRITIEDDVYDIYNNEIEDDIIEDFYGEDDVPSAISIDEAYFISDEQIIVKFSDFVRTSTLKHEGNYTFEYNINGSDKKLFAGDIEVVDNKTITIGFDYYINGGKLYLTIDNVYDYSEQFQYDDLSTKVKLLDN